MRRHQGSENGMGERLFLDPETDPSAPPVLPSRRPPYRLPIGLHVNPPAEPDAMPQRHRVREFRVTRAVGLQSLATALRRVPPAPSPAQTRPPGGFECEFLNPPDHLHLLQTKCPICLLVLRKPCMVTCCCHKFCESCIRRVHDGASLQRRSQRKACPLCNAVTYSIVHEKDLERTLNQLVVHCSHRKDGCQWSGQLGQLESHLNESPSDDALMEGCSYVQITCPNDCDQKHKRHTIQTHRQECALRQYSCSYCRGYVSTYTDVKENHWPQCTHFPAACPNNCGAVRLMRSELPKHLELCPQQMVSCEFSYAGCSVKVLRKKMADHLKTSMAAHLSLLSKQNIQLMKELAECKSRLTRLEEGGRRGRGRVSEGAMEVEEETSEPMSVPTASDEVTDPSTSPQ